MPSLPQAGELDWERTILDAAQATGWKRHAERAAVSRGKYSTPIKGDPGFPDLVLAHPRWCRLLIIELKRKPNRPTKAQLEWLDALEPHNQHADIWTGLVWVPDQVPALLRVLADPARFPVELLED